MSVSNSSSSPPSYLKAGFILSAILLFFLFALSAAGYLAVTSGKMEKAIITPLKEKWSQISTQLTQTLEPSPSPRPVLTISVSPSPVKININPSGKSVNQPQRAPCYQYKIREGEFASNKCYTKEDYNDLGYYLGEYSMVKFSLESARQTIGFTCNKGDFFKQSCDDATERARTAQADVDRYRQTINAIISRGK